MTESKFITELNTLDSFFSLYCKDKHFNQNRYIKEIEYKNKLYRYELNLCNECNELIDYSIQRLQNCEHDPKPRCRKCPEPCYDKLQWKKVAKVMRYSGIKLGLLNIKNIFTFNRNKNDTK